MNYHKTFSLSLQKKLEKRKLGLDFELNKAFDDLKIKSLLHRSHIVKQKGYSTATLLYMIILLPFLKKYLSYFWSAKCFSHQIDAQKDTYYRFLNCERFNWRKFLYFLAIKIIATFDKAPLSESTLIVDDTIACKSGKDMELVSYHFDHKTKRSILGNQCLQLGYHNGTYFFPIDMAFHTSKNRPNTRMRDIDKRTNGWCRRKEALRKKTDVLLEMLDRAWKSGIDASFVLFDSWFAHDAVISKIYALGYGVICRLKRGRVKYAYQGQDYTLKQLWQVAKKSTRWLEKFQVKTVCLNVTLPKCGDVRILFVSDGKKQWQAFLCTDLQLEASEILTYYARRWTIEIFFKDAKQMLYLGKEQSNTFDAAVTCYSLVMIRYLLLVYILSRYEFTGVGPLFRDLSDSHLQLCFAEKIWNHIKELMLTSSNLICHEIDSDIMLYFLDIVEETIVNQIQFFPAKL